MVKDSGKMQDCLAHLGINLKVVWAPNPSMAVNGEIKGSYLLIYDSDAESAWQTLTHEICEFKLKEVTRIYRVLVNQLIVGYEKLAYKQKESFIEFLPGLFAGVQELKDLEAIKGMSEKEKRKLLR